MTRVLVDCVEACVSLRSEELTLRLEIFEHLNESGVFSARLWRIEHYRIQPTFPQVDGMPAHQPSDELILKEFEGLETSLSDGKRFDSASAARDYVLEELATWFHAQLDKGS